MALSEMHALSSRLAPDIVALLARENALKYAILRRNVAPSDSLGEGWSEYYAMVLGTCDQFCDKSDPKVLRTLADASYNPWSPFAIALARDHGPAILPRILEQSENSLIVVRSTGVEMLATVAEQSRQLSGSDRDAIHTAVIKAARDSGDVSVQHAGIRALGTVGLPSDVLLLQNIVASDAHQIDTRRGGVYPLREEALKSLQKIKGRERAR